MLVPFRKMTGAGNDFVVFDWRSGVEPRMLAALAPRVCDRRRGIGADGILLLSPGERADVRVNYVNADGSDAGMCGNGARCAAVEAARLGLGSGRLSLDFGDRIVSALPGDGVDAVRISLGAPRYAAREERIAADGREWSFFLVDTGVPHAVVTVPDVNAVPVVSLGREIRRHAHLAPHGANVDFVERRESGPVPLRTYERGVEGETLACGTGAAAAAVVAWHAWGRRSPVEIATRGGEILRLHLVSEGTRLDDVVLEGSADLVFTGEIDIAVP